MAWQSGSGQLRSEEFRPTIGLGGGGGFLGFRNHESKYIGGIKSKPPVNILIQDIAFEHGGTQKQESFNWKSGEYKDHHRDGTIAVWKVTLQLLKLTHSQGTQDTQDEHTTSDRQQAKDKRDREDAEKTYENNKYFADLRHAEKNRLRDKQFKIDKENLEEEHRLTHEREKNQEHGQVLMKHRTNALQK